MAQSPVSLLPKITETDKSLGDGGFNFAYEPEDLVSITNNGYTWQVDAKPDAASFLTANHLPGRFRLVQFHAHWGQCENDGSEHLVDGKGLAAELHLVHRNEKYPTMEEALQHKDGLAVIGIFIKESGEENKGWAHLAKDLAKIHKKGDTVPFTPGLDIDDLMPADKRFWTYEGSLTTPPYSEAVIWTVFKIPTTMSSNQLAAFRAISERNVREEQPLNGRVIRSNYED